MLRTKCYAVYAVSQCIISDGELFSLSIYLSPSLSVCIALLMTLILSNSVALFVFLANRSSLPCYFFHHYNIISHRSFPLLPISPSLSSLSSLPLPPPNTQYTSPKPNTNVFFSICLSPCTSSWNDWLIFICSLWETFLSTKYNKNAFVVYVFSIMPI